MRPLGHVQRSVLQCLSKRGEWSRRSGWVWTTAAQTERILETLVQRGLASKEPGPPTVFGDGTTFSITEAGKKVLAD